MSSVLTPTVDVESTGTLADVVERLGGIPLNRIRSHPPPGQATVADVVRLQEKYGILCELVDGVLVEKTVGYRESRLAVFLSHRMDDVAQPQNLGIVTGADGTMEILADLVRIPDVAFTSWDSLPGRRMPDKPVPNIAPTIAVEILSASNTRAEMDRKRRECFEAGTQLFWEIDPRTRTARVYTDAESFTTLTEADALDGGTALPGFRLALKDLFAQLDRRG